MKLILLFIYKFNEIKRKEKIDKMKKKERVAPTMKIKPSAEQMEMKTDRKKILRTAVISRIIMFILCYAFSFFTDFDTSNETYRQSDGIIPRVFGSFSNWDGVYFSWIAEHGYTYEHFHAFFPLYPIIVRFLSSILSVAFPAVSFKSLVLISGFLISNVCFVVSAVLLYDVSMKVLRDTKISYAAAMLYCINPASVFMSSLYTESLFAMLTFWGLRFFVYGHTFVSTLVFMMASSVRSNGTVAAGFILYDCLNKNSNIKEVIFFKSKPQIKFTKIIKAFFGVIFQILIIFVPYFAIQFYGNISYGYEPFFNFYGNIQSKYWNQGFLKYFRLKQIPNFILAAPIFVTSFSAAIIYWYKNYKSKKSISFGFFGSDCIPFIGYLFVITLIAFFCMHVQVATRFILSSSPTLYWWFAYVSQKNNKLKAIIVSYSLLYFVLGSVMFTNFYPWT